MKLIEIRHGVTGFFLYDGEETLIHKDKIEIGDKILSSKEDDDYYCVNDVLYKAVFNEKNITASHFRYDGTSFTEADFRFKLKKYFDSQCFCSYEYEYKNGIERISLKCKEEEFIIEFAAERKYKPLHFNNDILMLSAALGKGLLFYTQTGERLWEYQVEEGLEIYEDAIIVVDDIVVITCTKNTRNYSVEGFKLSTGEKVWEIYDVEHCRKKYVQGSDKMLYSLMSFHSKDHTLDLRLTKLNPFTGDVEMTVLKEGNYWTHIWPWNTTIHGNKLFYTNLITEQGCSIGVVDLDKKELIEDFPMESQGNQIEKPIVTDDKSYVRVRDLNELRIYENEYK